MEWSAAAEVSSSVSSNVSSVVTSDVSSFVQAGAACDAEKERLKAEVRAGQMMTKAPSFQALPP